MFNLIFTNSSTFGVIELWGAEIYDKATEINEAWKYVIQFYNISLPHRAPDPKTQSIIDGYDLNNSLKTHNAAVKNSDLIVNIDPLRDVLQKMIGDICLKRSELKAATVEGAVNEGL